MNGLLPNFTDIFKIAYLFVVVYYGWVIFIMGLIYMLWRLYRTELIIQYIKKQKWVNLQIRVPRENRISTVAVDNIFSQLHALHVAKTFFEKYVEGQIVQLWYSLELVSLGGKVSFIIRTPVNMKHNVEAAFYSQYPTAEITEVADYLENVKYNPYQPSDLDLFGTEWRFSEDQVIPMKTYKDFEHPSADEKILDPLSHVFEGLAKIEAHEFFGIQIIIMPLADEEWKGRSEKKIKELTGEEMPHQRTLMGVLLSPFGILGGKTAIQAFRGGDSHSHGAHSNEEQNKPRNNWLSMTEAEKMRVTLIENKANKPGYWTKIRFLYMAPKEKFDKSKVFALVGAYRPFTAPMYNKIKPDVHKTWTHAEAKFSPTLEQPFLDRQLKYKKYWMFKGYKVRDFDVGSPMFIMNTEELATLYHFPLTTETTMVHPSIEQTMSKTSQPPANLPIAEM